jgi:hypothetical protein
MDLVYRELHFLLSPLRYSGFPTLYSQMSKIIFSFEVYSLTVGSNNYNYSVMVFLFLWFMA